MRELLSINIIISFHFFWTTGVFAFSFSLFFVFGGVRYIKLAIPSVF